MIRFYWLHEFEALDSRQRAETLSPIQNKIGILLSNPFIRSILCQNASTIDIADVMNTGKVLIVNLSKGNLGTEPAHLLGALLISAASQAAEARRNIPEEERRDFTLYVDEFQNFATDSFASILSEARKWRLSLVAANQHVAQLPENLQHAVFGNAGTIVAFRVGALDAPMLAAELGMPSPRALRETNNFHAWLRLMRDGAPLEPHLIKTPPPQPPAAIGCKKSSPVPDRATRSPARSSRPGSTLFSQACRLENLEQNPDAAIRTGKVAAKSKPQSRPRCEALRAIQPLGARKRSHQNCTTQGARSFNARRCAPTVKDQLRRAPKPQQPAAPYHGCTSPQDGVHGQGE